MTRKDRAAQSGFHGAVVWWTEILKAKRMVSLSLPRSILPKFHLVWLLRIIVFFWRETIYLFNSI